MGKGSRNRIGRDDDILVRKPRKAKKHRVHRPLPKWVVPVISAVVAVAIAVTAIMLVLMNNGTFKRTNILVKSQESRKYSINQQTAQVLIWTSVWDQASTLYEYGYYGSDSSKFELCWSQAMTAKYNIHEYIGDYYAQTLTSLVAYCDEGVRAGIEFTKEEQDEAYDSMLTALKSEAYDYYSHLSSEGLSNISAYYVYYASYPYFGQYLKSTLGNDIKEKDIRRAAVIQAYANKVYSLKQNEFWETTAENIAAEVKANPEKYYTTDYLTYSTEDAALADKLSASLTADAFKTAIVSNYVKNNYFNLYNKYVTKKVAEVNTALDAVSGKTTAEDLNEALTAQGMTATEYTAENAEGELTGDAHIIAHWLFPEEEGAAARKQFDATTLTTSDGLKTYVVVVSAVNEGTVTAAYKEFTYETLTDAELAKLTNTVAKALNISIAEDAAVYDESASEKADAIVKALNAENADKEQILTENGVVVSVDGLTAESDANTIFPAIRDAVFAEGVKSGDVLKVGSEPTFYVVWIKNFTAAVEANEEAGTPAVAASADISYITVEEKMSDVVDDLVDGLDSEIPSESSASFQKSVAVKVAEYLAALNAAEDKANYLLNKGASAVENMTDANHAEKSVPDEVSAAVLAEGVTAGSILTVDKPNSTTKYIIYVSEVTENGVNFDYLTVSTYEAGSYEEWLFGSVDLDTMTGGAAAGTTFTKNPTDGEEHYHVYLATGTMKKDTEKVVRGGYVSFDSQSDAEQALSSLSGLQGYALLNALAELNSNAVTSDQIRESSVEGELKNWLFSDARVANEAAVVTVTTEDEGETSTAYYVAVFVQGMEAWESTARTNYASESVGNWIDGVISEKGYAISEKALKRVKNPKVTESDSSDESQEGETVTETE